jgi:hypothetical protein
VSLLLLHHPLHLVHVPTSLLFKLGGHLLLDKLTLLEPSLFLLELNLVTLPLIDLEDFVVGEVPVYRVGVLLDFLLCIVFHSDLSASHLIFILNLAFL